MKSFHKQYKNQIEQLANRMRNETMPSLTEELFALFENTGNRLKYEDVYFARRKFLAVFGMAAYLWRRPADMVKLEEILVEICGEECWALPAHVNRRENPGWRNTVDLFAAETAQALSEIVVLLGENVTQQGLGLSREICERVKDETERRVLRPFEAAQQGWECSDHNWNAVCSGSIGSAAMYLLAGKEEKRLQSILQRVCYSLTFYLDGFREDGACMEGVGYFTYGMTYFTGFAEQLFRYSKGAIDLFDNEKVRRIAEFQQKIYFCSGRTVSFSDGDSAAKFRMGLTSFLSRKFDTVRIPDSRFAADFETDPCYRFMGLLRDYEWTKDATEEGSEQPGCASRHDILPEAQWSICESKNGIGFAIKGGDNDEPHNHNDVGSFIYLVGGEPLITDLGAGEYTAEYFGEGRYNILCNSSLGHSVPICNGMLQRAGKQYKASSFTADGAGTTKIAFAGAYEDGVINELDRTTVFSLEEGTLWVEDRVQMSVGMGTELPVFTENLVTQGAVVLQENAVIIQGKRVSCMVQTEGKTKNLRVMEKNHSNHEGETEIVRLIQWEVLGEKGEEFHGVSKYTIRCI